MEDEASTIQCLEMQIQSLNNAQVASEESAHTGGDHSSKSEAAAENPMLRAENGL
eukprot:CAMPEP_0172311010 /NCGR_PEP_ID=MMETSP1058-20130122/13631_1 /TAXON_ID=83371 /ORGANISM="Detonula confervacea, Strain CCMP 353" /LENGTH=54 /DNA_ID=CAMNT_0013024059 /DNA_START=45 /DNA_END=206 /DNA_ORIENTATION=+